MGLVERGSAWNVPGVPGANVRPALTGAVRLPNEANNGAASAIFGRNTADTADIRVAIVHNDDAVGLGAGAAEVRIETNGGIGFLSGLSTPKIVCDAGIGANVGIAIGDGGAGVQLGLGTTNFGGGVGVVGIRPATTNPTTNPAGGILYVPVGGGALTYRGSAGTVTAIAPA
jgi:hypothetical protein